MRNATLRILLTAALFGGLALAASAQPSPKIGPIAARRAMQTTGWSRVIITAADGHTPLEIEDAIGHAGGALGRPLPIIGAYAALLPNAALNGLANSAAVIHLALDRPVAGTLERTGATIGATSVRQELGYDGSGVGVAVIDSGITAYHDDLAGLGSAQRVDRFVDFVNGRDTAYDDYGHGTHVAGIIALVAPDAKIIPIRVLDQRGIGNTWVLAEALAYAVDPDGNPKTKDGADVINLSLSTLRRTSLLKDVLERACSDVTGNPNLVVVAAAGNGGDFTEQYPAAENVGGLLAVAASTEKDSLAWFSTRGSWIRVAAPGVGITSTVPGGQFGTWEGTSMAAPFVAGAAALVHARFPRLENTKIVDQITKTAVRIDGPVQARLDLRTTLTVLK